MLGGRDSCYCLTNNDFKLACHWGTYPLFTTRLTDIKQAKTDGDIQIKNDTIQWNVAKRNIGT